MSRIENVMFRPISDSCGNPALGIQVRLEGGFVGEASSPNAKKPGKREGKTSIIGEDLFSNPDIQLLTETLLTKPFSNQTELDTYLGEQLQQRRVGTNMTLPVSLSYARAVAAEEGMELVQYIARLGNFTPSMPHALINIFSGGIHGNREENPFQQIMIIPKGDTFLEEIVMASHIYFTLDAAMNSEKKYSASQGMLIKNVDYEQLLQKVSEHIAQLGYSDRVSLGIDAAAEHMQQRDKMYLFGRERLSGEQLYRKYESLLTRFNLTYLEDPFAPDDAILWQRLLQKHGEGRYIVGDDLFATNKEYIDANIANGILIKMNQIGTLTGTLEAVKTARDQKIKLCVSHRSCETGDTAMGDLAAAIGAELIKIGGLREERLLKTERLLELSQVNLNTP